MYVRLMKQVVNMHVRYSQGFAQSLLVQFVMMLLIQYTMMFISRNFWWKYHLFWTVVNKNELNFFKHVYLLKIGPDWLFQVVSPTIHNPSCQEQLIDSAKLVAKSVDGVMETAQVRDHDITWAAWHLRWLAHQLFAHQLGQVNNKEKKIKVLHCCPFVRGIHRWPVDSPHKWPVIQKVFPCHVIVMMRRAEAGHPHHPHHPPSGGAL